MSSTSSQRRSSPRNACVCVAVVLLTSVAGLSEGTVAPHRAAAGLAKEWGRPLCKVPASTPGGLPVSIWARGPGLNQRAISFDDAASFESVTRCDGDEPHCEPLSGEGVATDVDSCPPCPCRLDAPPALGDMSETLQLVNSSIAERCAASESTGTRPQDILMIGLGGGSLHTYVRLKYPKGARIRSIEVDPRFAHAASRYFGVPLEPGESEIVVGDALDVAKAESSKNKGRGIRRQSFLHTDAQVAMGEEGWDFVVVDCFIGKGRTPEHCRSKEFVEDLHALLRPNGIAVQHIWHYSPYAKEVAPQFHHARDEFAQIFGDGAVNVIGVPRRADIMFDDVIVAHKAGI